MFIIIAFSLLLFLPNDTLSQHSSILTKNKTALRLDEVKKQQIGALHEVIMLNDQNASSGHWFNKGIEYKKCVKSLLHEKQLKDCEKYSGRMSTMDKIDLIKPDYEALVKKVVCVIQKINCPVNDRSFQVGERKSFGIFFYLCVCVCACVCKILALLSSLLFFYFVVDISLYA
ncbi:unnamed protein product [Trichobilharzia regenti]|nr:unnamed protein product [Trichobilharzia regenti]